MRFSAWRMAHSWRAEPQFAFISAAKVVERARWYRFHSHAICATCWRATPIRNLIPNSRLLVGPLRNNVSAHGRGRNKQRQSDHYRARGADSNRRSRRHMVDDKPRNQRTEWCCPHSTENVETHHTPAHLG